MTNGNRVGIGGRVGNEEWGKDLQSRTHI
jgi:hypothetical protein